MGSVALSLGTAGRGIARAPYRWDFRSPPMGICERRALGRGQRAADESFSSKGARNKARGPTRAIAAARDLSRERRTPDSPQG